MKKFILIFIFLFSNSISFSQNILSPSNVWYTNESSGLGPDVYYVRNKIMSDSVLIGNHFYHKVLKSVDSTGNIWTMTKKYTRESNGQLWVLDSTVNNNEVLIMDINLMKGNEFSYTDGIGRAMKLFVNKADTIIDLSGHPRKILYLSCTENESFRYRWIEGVGPDVGMFSSTFNHCLVDGFENSLTCFYTDDTQVWQNEDFDHCWKPSPPVIEPLMPILNSMFTRYVVINSFMLPNNRMERWKFNFLATVKENAKAYYELLVSEKEDGNDFKGSGRFFREEDNRFYQYISTSAGERLLYDMNLQAGDSIRIAYADGPRLMVVTKEDSIQLNDQISRKRLTLQCVLFGELDSGEPAVWIEGIGRLYEPFVDFSHCSIWDIARPEILCIYDGVLEIYKSETAPDDCWDKPLVIDTTDMDRSTIWYSSSLTGNTLPNWDCELKIDITKVMRDTLIGNRMCRIIGVTSGSKYYPESEIIEFSKNDKMYFYENDEWKLLYDYNAKVGDTISFHISKKYPYYFRFTIPSYYDKTIIQNNPYRLRVVKIDTIYDEGNKPLKRFITHKVDLQYPISMYEIIENVGSKDKLFGFNGNTTLPECFNNFPSLLCYSDDDISIKFTEGECDKITSSKDVSSERFSIYPNPGQNRLFFNLSDGFSLPVLMRVTDITGKLLMSDTQYMIDFSMNTSHLTSGLYIITIRDYQGTIRSAKWVKE